MLLHIYILYSSSLYPGLPCALGHLAGFQFPLFSLVKWSQVMLLLLRTEHSLGEVQHGDAEKAWGFVPGASEKHVNDEQGSPANALLGAPGCLHQGCGVPCRATRNILLRTAEGGNHMVSPPTTTKKPQKPKFGDAGGYSLKSSFYQSCLISFNKSVLCKWLMIVRILPRAKCTAISLRYSVFKKIKQNKTKQNDSKDFQKTWNV